jgi:hypothetical protein
MIIGGQLDYDTSNAPQDGNNAQNQSRLPYYRIFLNGGRGFSTGRMRVLALTAARTPDLPGLQVGEHFKSGATPHRSYGDFGPALGTQSENFLESCSPARILLVQHKQRIAFVVSEFRDESCVEL